MCTQNIQQSWPNGYGNFNLKVAPITTWNFDVSFAIFLVSWAYLPVFWIPFLSVADKPKIESWIKLLWARAQSCAGTLIGPVRKKGESTLFSQRIKTSPHTNTNIQLFPSSDNQLSALRVLNNDYQTSLALTLRDAAILSSHSHLQPLNIIHCSKIESKFPAAIYKDVVKTRMQKDFAGIFRSKTLD